MNHFFKVLKFFGLLDKENNLSITNVSVIVVLAKIAIAPSFTVEECGVLLIVLFNYIHKRHESNKAEQKASVPVVDLKPLQDQLDTFKEEFEQVKTDSAEAKDKASKLSLAAGFNKLR